MEVTDLIMLAGGLAFFLYGMKIMGEGLELAAGEKLKGILEKLTTNRFAGMAVGLLVTAVIQSSSATTVMVVSFVNAGLMNLSQAVGVIMGANIGTTVTGQLIALNISAIAPLFAFVGVLMLMFSKKKRNVYIGQIILGLGILFVGMNTMSTSMEPLRDVPQFQRIMTSFDNPFFGILAGMLVTCIIQSSSASVGILQALASQGLIGIHGAVFVIFGQNIGTCITSVLASVGTSKNAKRTALCHVLFNVLGTILFLFITAILPFTDWVSALTPGDTVKQIANVHTIFNIVTTIVLLPFGSWLAKLSMQLLPGEDKKGEKMELQYLDQSNFLDSTIVISNMNAETARMADIATRNLNLALTSFFEKDLTKRGEIEYQEELIDYLNVEIMRCIEKTMVLPLSEDSSREVQKFTIMISNLERIGDHAENIAGHVEKSVNKKMEFTKFSMNTLENLRSMLLEMSKAALAPVENETRQYQKVYDLEAQVDMCTAKYRKKHLEQMKKGKSSCEAGILYDEMLTDLERVADHLMNIAQCRFQTRGVSASSMR